jgi:immune inhibitor A
MALAAFATPARATMPPLTGAPPPEVTTALREGLLQLPARPSGLPVSATQPLWRVPVILVSYSDAPLTHVAGDFDLTLFDSTHATATGSVYDYYRWASGGRLTVLGRVVATLQLPHNKLYYGFNSWGLSRTGTPNNEAGLVLDALQAASAQVHWADFDLDHDGFVDMLWVVHAGIGGEASPDRYQNDLWSITSRLTSYWSNSDAFETQDLVPGSSTQHIRVDRFSVLPELSAFVSGQISEIGVYCHEFGHALGLPDLYNTLDGGVYDVGPGNWSLMSTGAYGGNGYTPQYPSHPGAWPAVFLGWAQTLQPTGDTLLVMPPIDSEQKVLEFWFQGQANSEHFLVESRRREGFDRNLPADGLIVYHVDDTVIGQGIQSNTVNSGLTPGLAIVAADGRTDLTRGGNHGDAGDVFPGTTGRTSLHDSATPPSTSTFAGAPTGIGLWDITPVSQGVQFLAQVRPLGWLPAVDRTVDSFAPTGTQGPATTTVLAPDGNGYSVASEMRSDHFQVVLRSRIGGSWSAGLDVSHSSGDAFEPALAGLGAHDLALVWSDTRSGRARIYYAARVGGVWTPAQLLTPGSGEFRSPAIGVDDRGEVHVAWLAIGLGLPQIVYQRFPYLSPIGQPIALSGVDAVPENPVVAVNPTGGAKVIWTDNANWPPTLWFARCAPDSVPGAPNTLTVQSSRAQTWVQALVDSSGALHSLWIESGSSVSELHFQRRTAAGGLSPVDTVLEAGGGALSAARLTRDHGGGLHVAFVRAVSGVSQVRYRRRHPTLGWDAISTDITLPETGPGAQPGLLSYSTGNVDVLYQGVLGGQPRFMVRSRVSDAPPTLAVTSSAPGGIASLAVLPNPAHAGESVEIRWSSAPGPATAGSASPGTLEVFDLLGRCLAVVPLEPRGAVLLAHLGSSLTRPWSSGVYFLRVRGDRGPAQRLVVLR